MVYIHICLYLKHGCEHFLSEHQKKNEQVDEGNPAVNASINADAISKALSSVQPMDTSSTSPAAASASGSAGTG